MLAPLELEIAGSLNTELALPRHFYSPPHGNLSLLTPVVASSGRADAGEARIYHGSDFRLCVGFRTPAVMGPPRARAAGVRKAPRHEIAGRCGTVGAAGSMGI
jgi:hypothetical protein